MITEKKIQQIAIVVIKILIQRFENFPVDASKNRNAPFHEAFLNAFQDKLNGNVSDTPFFISLSSWLHGLNTTLGQTFFERVAHILSDGEKREYTSKKIGNKQIKETQKNNINEIMTKLSNGDDVPNLLLENDRIFINDNAGLVNALDFSADVFIEDNQSVTAIELKSVKPNSGEMRGEKQKILEGKAALHKLFPNKKINFFVGFPFDPTSEAPTEFDKTRFLGSIINMTKFFDPSETLVARELWDYLSGEDNTMEKIIEIINKISKPDFMEKFNFINSPENRSDEKYLEILGEWFLYSEVDLVKNDLKIKKLIQDNQILQRVYNQQVFKKDEYNWGRLDSLAKL